MIILQQIHQVIGEREFDFEETFRDALLRPDFDSKVKLLWFAWSSHGTGEGYEALSVIGFRDLSTWNELDERTRYGDLASWATAIDGMRYSLHSTLNRVPDWSPTIHIELSGAGPKASPHEPSQLRLDTVSFGPDVDDGSKRVCDAAAESSGDLLELIGCWIDYFGNAGSGLGHFLSRIRVSQALSDELDNEAVTARWAGSPSVLGRLPRSLIRSRFLRTVPWSPLS
ncbi:MAG TPA: hypothetical protein VHS97_14865 [Isosphaeraceae bacterium]|nr:hypothetical protein [Isosphaeraceae bacterium]